MVLLLAWEEGTAVSLLQSRPRAIDPGFIRDEEDFARKKLPFTVCDFAKELTHLLDYSSRADRTLLKFEYNVQRLIRRVYADGVGQPPRLSSSPAKVSSFFGGTAVVALGSGADRV